MMKVTNMFITKAVKTKTLGEFLQACRANLGLTLEDVASVARVQPKYLLALEEGRFGELPAEVYVKGFLTSLSQIYRVDTRKLWQQYLAEHEVVRNLELSPKAAKPPLTMPRFILSPKTLTILGVAVLGFLSLAYLYFQISSLSRPPYLAVSSPATDGIVQSGLLVVSGSTEPGAEVYLNGQPIVVDVNGNFRENLSLGRGTNMLTIRAVNKFGRETVVARQLVLLEKAIAGSFTDATGSGDVATSNAPFVTVEVKIGPTASWISLESDGQEIYEGTMLAGATKKITAREMIRLTTKNAGSTRVLVNGKDFGKLGKDDETIKDIEFTR